MPKSFFSALTSAAFAAGCLIGAAGSVAQGERASLLPCPQNKEYRCGKISVFEDREHATGRRIRRLPIKNEELASRA